MLKSLKNLKVRELIIMIILWLLFTDITILFNISVLREFTTPLFITIVPGMLILTLMNLNHLNFLKKFVLWIGISLSSLILIGLFLNSLYPFIKEPLSSLPLLLSLNFFIIITAVSVYLKGHDESLKDLFNFELTLKNRLVSPLIFPTIFPILSILGTYFMNNFQNNTLILVLLVLIPIYSIVIVYLNKKNSPASYPFAVLMISLALTLIHGLTSNYIIGRDVQSEFYCFQLTLDGYHWDLNEFYNPYNACLSITILPVIYQVLGNIPGAYIFKVIFAAVVSIIPVIIYIISQRYVGKKGAFIISLLFVSQSYFIYLLGISRQGTAFIFFFLTVMLIFDPDMEKLKKNVLIFLFAVLTLLSHYTTAYVSLIIILPILAYPFLTSLFLRIKNFKSEKKPKISFENFYLIFAILAVSLVWYILIAKVQFEASTYAAGATINTLTGTMPNDMTRDTTVLSIFGIGIKSIPNAISVAINDIIFIIIGWGLISRLRQWKTEKILEKGFILGSILSVLLLIAFVLLPNVSLFYGPPRLFLQLLVFLGPFFVLGGIAITQKIKREKFAHYVLVSLVVLLFFCGTYLQYHALGEPYSPYYEKNGAMRDEHYIYSGEVASASWLKRYRINLPIQQDAIAYSRIMLGYGTFNTPQNISQEYTYLGYANTVKKLIYPSVEYSVTITDFGKLFPGKSLIYNNGYSQILIGTSSENSQFNTTNR